MSPSHKISRGYRLSTATPFSCIVILPRYSLTFFISSFIKTLKIESGGKGELFVLCFALRSLDMIPKTQKEIKIDSSIGA